MCNVSDSLILNKTLGGGCVLHHGTTRPDGAQTPTHRRPTQAVCQAQHCVRIRRVCAMVPGG